MFIEYNLDVPARDEDEDRRLKEIAEIKKEAAAVLQEVGFVKEETEKLIEKVPKQVVNMNEKLRLVAKELWVYKLLKYLTAIEGLTNNPDSDDVPSYEEHAVLAETVSKYTGEVNELHNNKKTEKA